MTTSDGAETSTSREASLHERLEQIRSSPNLQSQQQTAVVLSAVEETLKDQSSDFTPTAYFAALLSLLAQYLANAAANNDVATAVVYLLDLITPHVPNSILRSKFSQIATTLEPSLSRSDADAPFVRSAIGCLVSLLLAQDSQAWALAPNQLGPRQATAGLLTLALDHRPKVRKRAQDGLHKVLTHAPPSPSVDHPAADMCAETALRSFEKLAGIAATSVQQKSGDSTKGYEPALIHAMQLVKTIASACGGWPSRRLESLCEVLFSVAKSRSEFLTVAAFDVFEAIFEGMAKHQAFSKLPRLLEAVSELQPSQNDTQLLPPWMAIISRGYDVSSQLEAEETFQKLPDLFKIVSSFLASSSYNIRVSASECLVSLLVNCVPASVILEPSIYDQKTLVNISQTLTDLLSVKYQASWMEVFTVLGAAFDNLLWRSEGLLDSVVATIGELRAEPSFSGKPQADEVLSKAITAMGPEAVLAVLPLNLMSSDKQGRAWLVPLIRDAASNTKLAHFKAELVPLSEKLYEKVTKDTADQKTMETKILETLISQIWSTLPGYCDRPIDVRGTFDQPFAELLCNILYQQPELRHNICRGLQNLVDTNKLILGVDGEEDLVLQGRITKAIAQANLEHLALFAPNLLAVLFNVYDETSTQQRGPVLECIDSYLSITSAKELSEIFERVTSMLETSVKGLSEEKKSQKQGSKLGAKPAMTHALMDIVVTAAVYLPRESFQSLFNIASVIITQQREPQLQKKAYKLIPRLARSQTGQLALTERSAEVRQMLIDNSDKVTIAARKDRLHALSQMVEMLAPEELYFIPAVLPEVILATKENAERARTSAFDLLVLLGEKMRAGGIIDTSKGSSGLTAPSTATPASLEEYLTMLSAGLAGNSPHMISASVTAISRVLFAFHSSLSEASIVDLLQTMDLFLRSPSREIVRSVLGFVKVCVIVLPTALMAPRLPNIVPALVGWSHEQKAHFRVKVKAILERMIRRFGVDVVEKNCPLEDRKLIANIRKTRERRKRKKSAATTDGDQEDDEGERRKQKYENEFDEAIYGSDESDSEGSVSDDEGDVRISGKNGARRGQKAEPTGARQKRRTETYIHESADEPLDLLDRKALANISSTRPAKGQQAPPRKRKAKVDLDGRLILHDDDDGTEDNDADMMDVDDSVGLEKGINAYVDAIRGRDAATRGQRGRLKFSNKRGKGEDDEGEEEGGTGEGVRGRPNRIDRASRAGRSGRGGIGGRGEFKSQRRGLGIDKRSGNGGGGGGGGIEKRISRGGVGRSRGSGRGFSHGRGGDSRSRSGGRGRGRGRGLAR